MTLDPGASALADFVFPSRYANFLPELSRRETYPEAVRRVHDMHREKYAGLGVDSYIDEAEAAMLDKLVLGSQRALQFGGAPMLKKNARGYNCTFSYADRPRFFAESFWLLLCGCGVGFSVQKHHVAKLPKIWRPARAVERFVVPDTIEGWADALDALVSSYFTGGPRIEFDYSLIRAYGARLSSGVGKAPGAEPLRKALEDVRELLDRCLRARRRRLRPIDVYDIVMFASQAVLSGGVRRSATICLFSLDDEEMILAKTGDWHKTNAQRARSNNSAVLLRGAVTFDQFDRLVKAARMWGEPGFYWVDDVEIGTNPCCEIGLYPVDELTGETGWQFCNLSTINMARAVDESAFLKAVRAAAILGTLQAGYLSFPYLGAVSERITAREALLGVSMTGMQENRAIAFNREILTRGARYGLEVNAELAPRLGVNLAARLACVKPEGSGSCLLGTTSGIGKAKGEEMIRRVQESANSVPALAYQTANPHAVEPSRRIGDSGIPDLIVSFAIKVPAEAAIKPDDRAVDFLRDVRLVKEAWVDAGKRPELCVLPSLSHNVSNTVDVKDHEWDEVAREIYDHRDSFAGVSLLSDSGDLVYEQAPFTALAGSGDRSAVRAEFENLQLLTVPVAYESIIETEDGTDFTAISACAGGSCLV